MLMLYLLIFVSCKVWIIVFISLFVNENIIFLFMLGMLLLNSSFFSNVKLVYFYLWFRGFIRFDY